VASEILNNEIQGLNDYFFGFYEYEDSEDGGGNSELEIETTNIAEDLK
jgi:hypothetical protein